MKRKLVFATNNQNKFNEIRNILEDRVDLVSLKELNFNENIPEDHNSLEDNAMQKAFYIYNKYHIDCFSDDTGLEIEALNGKPGVHSARYAGNQCNFDDNIKKVLAKMKGVKNRNARFRTVISLVEKGSVINFEGCIYGRITTGRRGEEGFGYDPIFQPSGYALTFAQMEMEGKNKISHRAMAIEKLVNYLIGENKLI
jgi:XTP/dITP diphosphohydrolase